jgi:hypothetical protein
MKIREILGFGSATERVPRDLVVWGIDANVHGRIETSTASYLTFKIK